MLVLGVYTYGVSFVPNSYGKVLGNEWVQPPPCAKTGVKSSLGTIYDRCIDPVEPPSYSGINTINISQVSILMAF